MTPLWLFLMVLAASIIAYAITATVLIRVLRDRYRSVPPSRVTAGGAAIFVGGIGLLFISGEQFWVVPKNLAVVFGSVGAAIVNVGATMIVGPWLAGLVASDLRRMPIARGTRGTEAHLAIALVKVVRDYGGTVEYDHDGTFDFNVHFGRRDLRVELGAITPTPAEGDLITDPDAWFRRIDALLTADPPGPEAPVLVVVNDEMLAWLKSRDLGFGRFDDDPYFAFMVWNGSARDDSTLQVTIEALLFGITNSVRRAAITPSVTGLGTGNHGRHPKTPHTRTVAD